MDNTNNKAIDVIAESIVKAGKEIASSAEFDKTVITTIIASPDKHGNYGVIHKGHIIYAPNYSGRELNINDEVLLTFPSNDYKQMYISAVRDDSIIGSGSGGSGTNNYNSLNNKPRINGVTLSGNKTTSDLRIEVPVRVSDLVNDRGYITANDLPPMPTVPTKTSQLTNDSGFITAADIPAVPDVPTKLSELTNDVGFITAADIPSSSSAIAENVTYNNTSSRLRATNVQAAIDEIAASGGGGGTPIVIGDDYVSKDEFVQFVNLLVDKLGS